MSQRPAIATRHVLHLAIVKHVAVMLSSILRPLRRLGNRKQLLRTSHLHKLKTDIKNSDLS